MISSIDHLCSCMVEEEKEQQAEATTTKARTTHAAAASTLGTTWTTTTRTAAAASTYVLALKYRHAAHRLATSNISDHANHAIVWQTHWHKQARDTDSSLTSKNMSTNLRAQVVWRAMATDEFWVALLEQDTVVCIVWLCSPSLLLVWIETEVVVTAASDVVQWRYWQRMVVIAVKQVNDVNFVQLCSLNCL